MTDALIPSQEEVDTSLTYDDDDDYVGPAFPVLPPPPVTPPPPPLPEAPPPPVPPPREMKKTKSGRQIKPPKKLTM
jgi:hypothetical protein